MYSTTDGMGRRKIRERVVEGERGKWWGVVDEKWVAIAYVVYVVS
jgi:hypothetical protein